MSKDKKSLSQIKPSYRDQDSLEEFKLLSDFWRKSYNRQASDYDSSRYGTLIRQAQASRVYELLNELLYVDENIQVLDVATGTGIVALRLARSKGHIIGVDISEGMLNEARKKAKNEGLSNIQFVSSNAGSLPFADNSFDIVVSLKFLHRIPNDFRKPLINQMVRVLKPGGTLVVNFNNPFFGNKPLYRYLFMKNRKTHYLWPWQELQIFHFKNLKRVRVVGEYLPLTFRIARKNPKLARVMFRMCNFFPFNRFSYRPWIVFKKN